MATGEDLHGLPHCANLSLLVHVRPMIDHAGVVTGRNADNARVRVAEWAMHGQGEFIGIDGAHFFAHSEDFLTSLALTSPKPSFSKNFLILFLSSKPFFPVSMPIFALNGIPWRSS